jgi:hypothetical protein
MRPANTGPTRVLLVCGNEYAGIVERLIVATRELGHDVVFVDSAAEREYVHQRELPPNINQLIEQQIFPKIQAKPDRSRIQDRWGKYK